MPDYFRPLKVGNKDTEYSSEEDLSRPRMSLIDRLKTEFGLDDPA